MSLIQLATPFRSFRGRSAAHDGQVLYPYFGRNVSRSFVVPANDRTPYQTAMRTLFADLNALYSDVSDADNEGWKTLAPHLEYDDKDGNRVHVPAKSAFISINFWRTLAGQPVTTTAPVYAPLPGTLTLSNPRRSLSVSSVPSCSIAASDGWKLDYSWTGPPAFIALKNTPPLPGLRRQPKPCDYRFSTDDPTNSIFPISSPGETIIIPDSLSRFPITEGNRIALLAQVLSDSFIQHQQLRFQSIVAEA